MTSATPFNTADTLRWNLDSLSKGITEQRAPQDIRTLICATRELPPLPEIGRRLLELMDDPDADAPALSAIVEQDPLVSSQMIRWANSAYYRLATPVEQVSQAIARVLGFEQALNLALGLSSLRPLQTPRGGLIGRDSVWRHGIRCGRLMTALLPLLPPEKRVSAGLAQLAGLTQNIGYLLLGHLLPAHFSFLDRILDKNGRIDLPVVESFALGVTHAQLGHWLMEAWEMPEALQHAVRHHHNPAYAGDHESLILLCCLGDKLLAEAGCGIGPALTGEDLVTLARRLGVTPQQCEPAVALALTP